MFKLLQHLVRGENQFASGGLLLMSIGSMGVVLRSLPAYLASWFLQQISLTVTIKDDDAAFAWVKEWFLEQHFLKRVRRVDLDTTLRGTELALLPAPGTHLFWYGGRPFSVHFARSEDARGRSQRRVELLTFQTLGRRQDLLKQFVAEIVACHHRKDREISKLHLYNDGYWETVKAYSPRLLESVVLNPGEKERLVRDLEKFRAERQRYRRLGVPYHRGYLLHGPPGTGKSSLVSGLAAAFGMSIYVINLTELNDRSLKSAMIEVPGNSVVLFEDIDCMQAGHRRGEPAAYANQAATSTRDAAPGKADRFGVTLSGLLNVLDGFNAPENVIFIMTTNDVDALDPALLRPGRIDYRLFLGQAGTAQKIELYRRFFPSATIAEARHFAQAHEAQTMAEFQGRLLRLEHAEEDTEARERSPHNEGPPSTVHNAQQPETEAVMV